MALIDNMDETGGERHTLRIFMINDVYKLDNLPRMKTAVDRLSRGIDDTLVTLSGDFLGGNPLLTLDPRGGEHMIEMLGRVGVTQRGGRRAAGLAP